MTPQDVLSRIAALHAYIYSPIDDHAFAEGCVVCGEGWPCETAALIRQVDPS